MMRAQMNTDAVLAAPNFIMGAALFCVFTGFILLTNLVMQRKGGAPAVFASLFFTVVGIGLLMLSQMQASP